MLETWNKNECLALLLAYLVGLGQPVSKVLKLPSKNSSASTVVKFYPNIA